jgi:hypothetical protein
MPVFLFCITIAIILFAVCKKTSLFPAPIRFIKRLYRLLFVAGGFYLQAHQGEWH